MSKLTPCKACGHMISKSAKTCPNCGQARTTTGDSVKGFLILAAIGVIAFALFSGDDEDVETAAQLTPEQQADADAEEAAADLECLQDLQCAGQRAIARGGRACSQIVEAMARHDFEWTDGWLEPKFSHFRWADQAAGVVTIIGDKVKFQNGFGAFSNMRYECDWDLQNGSAIDARAQEGRV